MRHCTAEDLIKFERRIADIFEQGELPFLIHLSGGNEDQLIQIFKDVQPGDWIFSSHRNHTHYLLSGGNPDVLEQKIRNGDSMFVFGKEYKVAPGALIPKGRLPVNFLSSSILAGTCGIAAGVAWQLKQEGSQNRVWCFLGDGAEDEGHFYEAVMFVEGQGLPCTFIVEDNDRSVDTSKDERRGAASTKLPFCRFANCVRWYDYKPTYPHGGTGTKTWVKFKPEIVEKFKR